MTMVNGPAPSYSAEHLVTPHSPNHTHIHTALLCCMKSRLKTCAQQESGIEPPTFHWLQ